MSTQKLLLILFAGMLFTGLMASSCKRWVSCSGGDGVTEIQVDADATQEEVDAACASATGG